MASTSAPFGLRPHSVQPNGQVFARPYTIASGYASSIYKGSMVKLAATGVIEVVAAGEAAIGVFAGVEYTATATGTRQFSKHWPASTAATEITAWVYDDPDMIYEIEAEGALAQTNLGNMADLDAAADDTGSTITGLSSAKMDTGVVGTTTAQLQIVGLAHYADNAWGDTAPIVLVRIAEHQLRPAVSAGV